MAKNRDAFSSLVSGKAWKNSSRKNSVFKRLAEKIKNDTGIEVENLRRHYVGVNMKATGAFCWIGNQVGASGLEVGGCTPASELLKCKKLVASYGMFGSGRTEIQSAD